MAGPYVSLQQVLGAPNMLGIIKSTVSGIPDVWEPAFYNVPKICHGNSGTYVAYTGARQLATLSSYGAPSKDRQLRELAELPVILLHSVENIQLKPTDYMSLLAYEDLARQKMGIQEVTRQVKEFAEYRKNLRIAAINAMMFWGSIQWDDKGNLLAPSALGAAYGVGINYQVPVTNTGQGQDVYGNAIIGTSWSNTASDIVSQITNLKKTAVQRTGYPIKRAYYGSNIPGYLAQNTEVQAFLARAQYTQDAQGTLLLEQGEINKFLGIEWRPAYDLMFNDSNNVPQSQVGPDQITFTPEPNPAWVGMLEGTYPVPEFANVITQVEPVAANGLPQVETAGMFAYGVQTADPSGIKIVGGDTFLPVLLVPASIYQLVVDQGLTS